MTLLIEIAVLIVLFTVMCIINCHNVDEHMDWVALNYPSEVVEYLISEGRLTYKKPLSLGERLKKKFPVLVFMILLLSAIVYFVNGCHTFLSAFGTCFLIWTVIDWYDALVLDCLWFCHSKSVRVSGTENMDKAYGDYMFHIVGSARGMILGAFVSLMVGIIVLIFSMII